MFPLFSAVEEPIISALSFKLGKSLADVTLRQMKMHGVSFQHQPFLSALSLNTLTLEFSISQSSALTQNQPGLLAGNFNLCT